MLPLVQETSEPSADNAALASTGPMSSRRSFLQTAGWAAAGVPLLYFGNGFVRTVYDFQVERIALPIHQLPRAFEGVTIAQLSDIHAGSFVARQPVQELCRLTMSLKARYDCCDR